VYLFKGDDMTKYQWEDDAVYDIPASLLVDALKATFYTARERAIILMRIAKEAIK